MYRSYTCGELLSLSNDEVNNLKGVDVVITKRNGDKVELTIVNIMLAANEPHLPCGFVLSDGKEVRFDSIRRIELEK